MATRRERQATSPVLPAIPSSQPGQHARRRIVMAEKVRTLALERDYTSYLYFLDGTGNVCRKLKSGDGEKEILVPHAIERDQRYLYFIDGEGDISRAQRNSNRGRAA